MWPEIFFCLLKTSKSIISRVCRAIISPKYFKELPYLPPPVGPCPQLAPGSPLFLAFPPLSPPARNSSSW
ncbi:hypothetical protein PUN28_011468 [Cardiocondyla obscurior]|uniref:Uncharacterized protein n=1 Tax=Cardiocondyla obscurior TaxID=286306 RepID=A0AAW2FFA6_9HYME